MDGPKDAHLEPRSGQLAGAARSLNALHAAQQQRIWAEASQDAVASASDFLFGGIGGASPLPTQKHGATFHHLDAYRAGHVVGTLVGREGESWCKTASFYLGGTGRV